MLGDFGEKIAETKRIGRYSRTLAICQELSKVGTFRGESCGGKQAWGCITAQ
jgi:hypothetical protein